ncbi:DUF3383 domain-containing protein [Caballeronia telluris]|uniref:Exotoxin n=1 Tax=Caballeronia telluris TaxID=326475 RepID=A0A158G1D2_9BURK|nr:DUF3383 domain-containing protein [Caballeronia telluris]SAL25743.1 exotoxin [Caballeronia telluris]
MSNTLPISRLVNATITLTQKAAQSQNTSTLLILGTSAVIDLVSRFRTYGDITSVGTDFGTSSEEYKAAVLWFQQAPQPASVTIGRWAKTAAAGQLLGGTLSAAQQALSNFTAVTAGGMKITIDGTLKTLASINLSSVTNLNGVASAVTTALASAGTCVWNAAFQRFEITSATTGATSAVSFAQAPVSGTDISGLMGLTSTFSGAYVSGGAAAETALAAATLFDANFGQQWYALTIPSAVDADHVAVAGYIEATATKHFYGVSTQEAGVLVASDTTNVAYQLKALGYKKTAVQYSSSNAYAVVSLLARILTTDYTGNNTVITLKFKDEPGIAAENLNTTQANALEAFNCNVFVEYENDTAIIEQGVCSSGDFIDSVMGADNLAIDIQNAVFNLLYTSTTKIPQTDAGNHLIATKIEQVCAQYVSNGFLAAGVWNSGGFGTLSQGDYMPKGFYVYAPPIANQSQANRAARKSVAFQVAAKEAGAIHSVDIAITVNQ